MDLTGLGCCFALPFDPSGLWRLFRKGGDDGDGEGKATVAHVSLLGWLAAAASAVGSVAVRRIAAPWQCPMEEGVSIVFGVV